MRLELTNEPNAFFTPNDDDCDRCDPGTPAPYCITDLNITDAPNTTALCTDHAADYLLDSINS